MRKTNVRVKCREERSTTEVWDGMELMNQIRMAKEGGAPIRGERILEYQDENDNKVHPKYDYHVDKWEEANSVIDEVERMKRAKGAPTDTIAKTTVSEGGEE